MGPVTAGAVLRFGADANPTGSGHRVSSACGERNRAAPLASGGTAADSGPDRVSAISTISAGAPAAAANGAESGRPEVAPGNNGMRLVGEATLVSAETPSRSGAASSGRRPVRLDAAL